jgi:S1-C subfamily serine protease
MDRRPLWPLAVGIVGWIAVAVAAYVYDFWWPLYVAIPISVVPGLGAFAVWMGTRRARKAAPELMAAHPGPAPDPRDVAEPPRPSKGGVRTNARTAGRRKRGEAGAIAWMLALGGPALALEGCQQPEPAAAPGKATTETKTGADAKTETKTTPATSSAEQRALAAVLARAIKSPQGSDATYQVDPFVAALVYEQIRAGSEPSFTPLAAPLPDGGPQAGFRVGAIEDGSLLHTLGLRTGDVVEALNGVVLADASRVAFALDGAENRVSLTIFRDDISLVQSYKLTQALAWTELLASQGGSAIAAAEAGTAAPDDTVPSSEEGTAVPEDERGSAVVPDDGDDSGRAPSGGTPSKTPSGGGGKPVPSAGGGGKPVPSGGGGGGTTPTPPKPSGTEQVRCESSTRCTITRAYFDKMTSSASAISSQASIVPAISNDVFSGYKLKSVKAGSNVAKLGFQSGDKITHINGKDLTDDMEAAQVYFSLGGTKVFKIRYVRGGAALLKTVVVV